MVCFLWVMDGLRFSILNRMERLLPRKKPLERGLGERGGRGVF